MPDPERVKSKIKARNDAKQLLQLIEVPHRFPADYAETLLEELQKQLPKRRQNKPKPPPSYRQLASIEMQWGKYAHKTLEQVPEQYLEWLIKENEDFHKKLKAFLMHPERPVEMEVT